MGWKAVRDHYKIGHIVQVTDAGICIGSPYIHDIIVVSLAGEVVKPPQHKRGKWDWTSNEDLIRYLEEMEADPAKLRELIAQPDTFAASIPVFTYGYPDFEIEQTECEEPGWPNVTHDGRIMYENTFSTDRAKVVEWAKRNAEAAIEMAVDRQKHLTSDLNEAKQRQVSAERGLAALEQEKA